MANKKGLSKHFGQHDNVTNVGVEGNNHTATIAFSTANAAQMTVAAPPPPPFYLKGAELHANLPERYECKCAQNRSFTFISQLFYLS